MAKIIRSTDAQPEALALIEAGEVVAIPTETVYGLAADATNGRAVARIFEVKGRPRFNPLIAHVASLDMARAIAVLDPLSQRLAEAFWPGPLTLVVRCARAFAAGIARGDGAVGLRCSSHPVASAFASALARAGAGPVTATSLNHSGEPAAHDIAQARALCTGAGAPHLLDDAPDAGSGRESTVVDLTGPQPVVLRWGALSRGALVPLLEEVA